MFSIQEGMLLSAVQSDFSKAYPYLKLEFFKHRHAVGGANARKDLLPADGVLRHRQKAPQTPEIIINDDMTVAAFEQMFQDQFGLSVQVFRKSGKTWLETTFTDDWTLGKQNNEGFELSTLKP